MTPILEGLRPEPFEHEGVARTVFWRGDGPGVLVMPEIPGITPLLVAFAERLVAEGYTVAVPSLFGTPGRQESAGYTASTVARVCVAREFHVLARHGSSPITDWLRALARAMHDRCGGPGVGAIGMCFTGNFALTLMLEPATLVPVLSQPSLPFGVTARHRAGLHIAPADLATVRDRLEQEDRRLLALRFTEDALCPAARFRSLAEALGDRAELVEIDSGPGNPWGLSRSAHSVLTRELVDESGHPTRAALDRVLGLLAGALRPGGSGPPRHAPGEA